MHDVAIVGAGLSGLALARKLEQAGQSVIVIEARERLGGRILGAKDAGSGLDFDLGPTWYWPARQTMILDLIQELEIMGFLQRDEGINMSLTDPERGAQPAGSTAVHDGAHRVEGGMTALIEALAAQLKTSEIRLGLAVKSISEEGDHVTIACAGAEGEIAIAAGRVVLALPPRLVASLTFAPALDAATMSALQQTPTWMATSAKAAVACGAANWRLGGLSGSGFATHGQAVLAEVWDACNVDGDKAGLAGFLALTPEQRREFAYGLPMLMGNQFGQFFGHDMETGEILFHDWACEPFTCSPADLAEGLAQEHPRIADSLLRAAHWRDKLYFGGAETSAADPGYLEGAVDAAGRVARQIAGAQERARLLSEPVNSASTGGFAAWVATRQATAFSDYRRIMAVAMSKQDRDLMTQRALLESVEAVLIEALGVLETLPFDAAHASIEQGKSSLLPLVQAPFKAFFDGLLEDAFKFNNTSCALSNFPEEHRPSRDYKNAILRDIAAAWIEFCQGANALLIRRVHLAAQTGDA